MICGPDSPPNGSPPRSIVLGAIKSSVSSSSHQPGLVAPSTRRSSDSKRASPRTRRLLHSVCVTEKFPSESVTSVPQELKISSGEPAQSAPETLTSMPATGSPSERPGSVGLRTSTWPLTVQRHELPPMGTVESASGATTPPPPEEEEEPLAPGSGALPCRPGCCCGFGVVFRPGGGGGRGAHHRDRGGGREGEQSGRSPGAERVRRDIRVSFGGVYGTTPGTCA